VGDEIFSLSYPDDLRLVTAKNYLIGSTPMLPTIDAFGLV